MATYPDTRATVLVADHISLEQSGKIYALGLAFQVTFIGPNGHTPPQFVGAIIDFPASAAGDSVPVVIELRDETTDSMVAVPDERGGTQALRVQQLVSVNRPQVAGTQLPPEMPCRVQLVMGFPNGLPLVSGHRYAWKLEIDGTRVKSWAARFSVAAPPPQPVIGGPAGPTDIPNITSPIAEQDDEPEDS